MPNFNYAASRGHALPALDFPNRFNLVRIECGGSVAGKLMPLTYFLNRKNSICVVTLKGPLTSGCDSILDSCHSEAMAEPSRYVVLNMSGIPEVDGGIARSFVLFQQKLRQSSTLILCEISPDVATSLKKEGVIRDSEVQTDIMGALQYVLCCEKKGQVK